MVGFEGLPLRGLPSGGRLGRTWKRERFRPLPRDPSGGFAATSPESGGFKLSFAATSPERGGFKLSFAATSPERGGSKF